MNMLGIRKNKRSGEAEPSRFWRLENEYYFIFRKFSFPRFSFFIDRSTIDGNQAPLPFISLSTENLQQVHIIDNAVGSCYKNSWRKFRTIRVSHSLSKDPMVESGASFLTEGFGLVFVAEFERVGLLFHSFTSILVNVCNNVQVRLYHNMRNKST